MEENKQKKEKKEKKDIILPKDAVIIITKRKPGEKRTYTRWKDRVSPSDATEEKK